MPLPSPAVDKSKCERAMRLLERAAGIVTRRRVATVETLIDEMGVSQYMAEELLFAMWEREIIEDDGPRFIPALPACCVLASSRLPMGSGSTSKKEENA